MQDFITTHREEIAALCRKHHVRRLAIFGSAVRSDFDPARSDVDVVVEFEEIEPMRYFDNKTRFWEGLAVTLGRPIDLLTWKSVRNSVLRKEIEATQEFLYAA